MESQSSFSQQHMQLRFLIVASIIKPELWEELRQGPYQLYLDLQYAPVQRNSIEESDFIDRTELSGVFTSSPTFSLEDLYDRPEDLFNYNTDPQESDAFYESLLEWSRKWHLDAEWCRHRMHRVIVRQLFFGTTEEYLAEFEKVMNDWQRAWMTRFNVFVGALKRADVGSLSDDANVAWRMEWLNQYMVKVGGSGPRITPPPGFPIWDVEVDLTQKQYQESIREAIKREIEKSELLSHGIDSLSEAFIQSIIGAAKNYIKQIDKSGESPKKTQVDFNANLLRNLVWAAQFQVGEMKFTDIAKAHNRKVNKSTVLTEVYKILDFINLTGREVKPTGRPEGTTDNPMSTRQIRKRRRLKQGSTIENSRIYREHQTNGQK